MNLQEGSRAATPRGRGLTSTPEPPAIFAASRSSCGALHVCLAENITIHHLLKTLNPPLHKSTNQMVVYDTYINQSYGILHNDTQEMVKTCNDFATQHNLTFSTNSDYPKCKTKCLAFLKDTPPNLRNIRLGKIELPWLQNI